MKIKVVPKILVVDDIEMNVDLVSELLESLDIEIEIVPAYSGYEAIDKFEKNEIALVILDISMPDMDGFETLGKMRKKVLNRNVPALFLTANELTEEDIIRGIEVGAIDIISKPISEKILTGKVRSLLEIYFQKKEQDFLVEKLENYNWKLRESEQRFRRLTNSAVEAIILIDHKMKISFVNRATEKTFGYSKEELLNESYFEHLCSKSYVDQYKKIFDHYLVKGKTRMTDRPIELYGLMKNGLEFQMELSIASVETNQQPQAVLIIRDITKRKRLEQETLKAKELREANKVMKNFMDNVNHELRTPLNIINGISENLLNFKNDNLTKYQDDGLRMILSQGKKLENIVERLTEFKRKPDNVFYEEVSLNELLENIRSYAEALKANKPLEINVYKDKSLKDIIFQDKKRLKHILTNLIENAVKFTTQGHININFLSKDNFMVMEVEDTGQGIEKEFLKNIFKKFSQEDSTNARMHGGIGMGLALTYKLVKILKGNISVISEKNKGTKFTVMLPLQNSTM